MYWQFWASYWKSVADAFGADEAMKKHPSKYGRRQSDALKDFLHNNHGEPCPKQEFLATINHDLRTPLNAVIGFAQIIENQIHGKVPTEYRECAKHIQESGYDLLSKIESLLDAPAPEGPRRAPAEMKTPRKAKKLAAVD